MAQSRSWVGLKCRAAVAIPKRQRAAALQDLRTDVALPYLLASWSAAALCRFRPPSSLTGGFDRISLELCAPDGHFIPTDLPSHLPRFRNLLRLPRSRIRRLKGRVINA